MPCEPSPPIFLPGFSFGRVSVVPISSHTLSTEPNICQRTFIHISVFDDCCSFLPQLLSSWQEVKNSPPFLKRWIFRATRYLKNESFRRHPDWPTKTSKILTFTAMPFRSVEAEASVGVLFGTVLVLVSLRWIFDTGIHKHLAATWTKHNEQTITIPTRIM